MARFAQLKGMNKVISNLKKETKKLTRQTARNVKRAGLFVQRESQKIVPVDTGNLKGGAFTRNIGDNGIGVDVIVGYEAEYSVYVHEDLEARHGPARIPFRRDGKLIGPGGEGQQAKFLEDAVRNNRKQIFKIIAEGK